MSNDEEQVNKGGRPTQYGRDLEFMRTIRALYLLGHTDEQVAEVIGVSRQTIQNWMAKNQEFFDMVKMSKGKADELVEATYLNVALGYNVEDCRIFYDKELRKPVYVPFVKQIQPNEKALANWLARRNPEKWGSDNAIDLNLNQPITFEIVGVKKRSDIANEEENSD